jgi:hypothetical protein
MGCPHQSKDKKMKASELIYYLQNAVLAKGDHNVVVNTLSYTDGYAIENVEGIKALECSEGVSAYMMLTREPNTDARKIIKAVLDPHNVEQLKIAIEHMDPKTPIFKVKLGNMDGLIDWERKESYELWRLSESQRISKITTEPDTEVRGSKNNNKHVKKQHSKNNNSRRRKR